MNYFELYPGDYLRDTGELSLAQHGAYLLLMASYYSTEDGLPADRMSLFRITRAMTKVEQADTMFVAERFFTLGEDGRLHSARIDEDIQKAHARIDAARTNGAKGGRPRKPKANPDETQAKPTGFQSGFDPHNPDETQKKAHQTPYTNQEQKQLEASAEPHEGRAEGRACRLMRQAGCVQVNPSHPELIAAIAEGVSPETLADTAAEAVATGKTNPFRWAITTARARRAEGASAIRAGPQGAEGSRQASRQMQAIQALEQVTAHVIERNATAARLAPPRAEDGHPETDLAQPRIPAVR